LALFGVEHRWVGKSMGRSRAKGMVHEEKKWKRRDIVEKQRSRRHRRGSAERSGIGCYSSIPVELRGRDMTVESQPASHMLFFCLDYPEAGGNGNLIGERVGGGWQ